MRAPKSSPPPNTTDAELRKKRQTRHVPGHHPTPFLADPADFGSPHTPQELVQSQKGQIIEIPPPKIDPPVLDLTEVIGSQSVEEIRQSGQLVFHCAGDTGYGAPWDLELVAQSMALDLHRPNPADHPAFFFHLGDICYNHQYNMPESKANMYEPQFYVPYADYPAKILAIPGNHDSNPQEDPKAIDAFQENFCAPPPASETDLTSLLKSPKRAPMYQPGVYFLLDAPFVQLIGLFSNGGEKEGMIRGPVAGSSQWNFLVKQLKTIEASRHPGQRSALIVAMHHPPFSGGGGHTGSTQMLKDLVVAFNQAGIAPDAVLSGHAHLYQRFAVKLQVNKVTREIPFIVAGMGGHGRIQAIKPTFERTPVRTPLRGVSSAGVPDHSLRQYFNGFGHLMITVTNQVLTIDLLGAKTQTHLPVDSVTVDLNTNQITHETPSFNHPANGEENTAHPGQ